MPDPSSTCLLFRAISEGSGETAWMCRLAWSFPARICNKYLNHMKWYRQLCLTLHLRVFFLVQSVKALAMTAWMCRLAWSFPARICNKYLNHMKWYRQLCLTLHLRVFFLVQSVKALARLPECAGSPGLSLLAYAISTSITWNGIDNYAWPFIYVSSF